VIRLVRFSVVREVHGRGDAKPDLVTCPQKAGKTWTCDVLMANDRLVRYEDLKGAEVEAKEYGMVLFRDFGAIVPVHEGVAGCKVRADDHLSCTVLG